MLKDAGDAVSTLMWRRSPRAPRGVVSSGDLRKSPNTFRSSPAGALLCLPASVLWLSCLQAIAKDPTESSRGLLGYFSSTHMDLIESLFVTMGEPNPWGCIINPLWAAHLTNGEKAWDQVAETSAMPPFGEFPLSFQLYSPGSTHSSIFALSLR